MSSIGLFHHEIRGGPLEIPGGGGGKKIPVHDASKKGKGKTAK